ncbi:MAG: DUF11 domain-containing protein [Methanobrevibacter sp.]|jgi:uncharacterized repeat protein (TIGR01451 family)|nr:DUF11 domain-containing protein [Methanobrevibacter sp.]
MNLKPNIKIIVMLLLVIISITVIGVYADVESQNTTQTLYGLDNNNEINNNEINNSSNTTNQTLELNNLSINLLDGDFRANSDIYVDPLNGNDATGDGSASLPFKTINKSVTGAATGTTIHLSNGTYTGVNNTNIRIIVNDITITGESSGGVILDGENVLNTRFFYCYGGEYNITFNNIIFQNGKDALGGAIFVNNTDVLTISNCSFINNHAVGESGGGAIHFNCTLKLNNDQFINNSAPTGLGGALYSDGGDYSYTSNCTFIGNNATHGGAIDHVHGNQGTVVNSVFINNTATSVLPAIHGGGAIHIHGTVDDITNVGFTIENCSFTDNHANNNGGAVYTEDINTQIINSNFTNNSAANGGGAVFTSNSDGLKIDNSIFTYNTNNTIFINGNNSILTHLKIMNNTGYNDTEIDNRNALIFLGYNNTLNNSDIINNTGNGVYFNTGGGNYLGSSTIINNTRNGVIIIGSSNNIINYNRIYENGLGMDIGMNLPSSYNNNINHNWWGYNNITDQINDTGINTNNTDHYVLNLSAPDISTLVNASKIYNDSNMSNATLKYNFILNTSDSQYDKPNSLPYFVVDVVFKNNTDDDIINQYLDKDIRDPNSYSQLIRFLARTNYSVEALSDGEDVILDILSPLMANVTIIKTANNIDGVADVHNDTNINFILTVRNNGPDNATNVIVKDLLNKTNFQYLSNNANATYNNVTGELTWNVGDLEVNQSVSINVSVKVITTGYLLNIANVTGDNTPPNQDNVTIKSHPIYDAVINKTVNTTNTNIGDLVKYTITVKNLEDSQTVNVTDILDNKLRYISSNSSQGNYDYNTGLWEIGELAINQSANLDIIAEVNGGEEIANLATLYSQNIPPQDSYANITVNPPINPNGDKFDLMKNTGIPILLFLVLISIIGGTIYRKRK